MVRPSKEIMAFMEKFGIESDELWCVHGSTWVIKHKALERVAAAQNITFDRPAMIETNSKEGIVAICVFAKMGDRTEWSIGEASPKNCKNAYYYAIAEKRGKDRCILKLLTSHGDLYSEAEADEFTQRQNPHVTRPADILPPADYDEHGEVIDNVPHAPTTKKLRVADQRPLFAELQKEAHAFSDSKKFVAWMADPKTAERVAEFKADWQDMFRGICKEHLTALRTQERGDDMRMAG